MLQHAVSARPVQPRTFQELKDALVAEWRLIPRKQIRTLITSMRRRCRAVIDARGRHALLGKFVLTNVEFCENSVAKNP